MTTVGDEILNNCQAWIPVLCAREILKVGTMLKIVHPNKMFKTNHVEKF